MWVLINFIQFVAILLWFFIPAIAVAYILPKKLVYPFMNGAWCKWALNVIGVKLNVKGSFPDKAQSYMMLTNHQSFMDILVLNVALKRPLHFIAKKELTKIPLLGQIMRKTDCVLVSRGYGKESRKTYEDAIAHIKKGLDIVVFPEGTRSKNGKLGKLRKGSFIMAVDSGVPIVPIALINTGRSWPRNNFSFRPGVVSVVIGEPIATSDYTRATVPLLMETFENELKKILEQAS